MTWEINCDMGNSVVGNKFLSWEITWEINFCHRKSIFVMGNKFLSWELYFVMRNIFCHKNYVLS